MRNYLYVCSEGFSPRRWEFSMSDKVWSGIEARFFPSRHGWIGFWESIPKPWESPWFSLSVENARLIMYESTWVELRARRLK